MTTPLTLIIRLLHIYPNLSLTQAGILLAVQAQRQSIADLSQLLKKSETNIGVNISKLVLMGLVEKIVNHSDFRSYIIICTERGQALVRNVTEE
jgi:DNA-binding MarR family transcriptional regulator